MRGHLAYLLSGLLGVAGGVLGTLYRDYVAQLPKLLRNLAALLYVRLRFYPIVLKRYRQSVVDSCSHIRIGYRDIELDLRGQYVKLRLTPGFIPPFHRTAEELPRQTVTIEEVLKTEEELKTGGSSRPLRLVVLGQPGSGKTTLLKHLALLYAHEGPTPTKKRLIPILVFLREAREKKTLNELILSNFASHDFPSANEFVESKMKNGECLLLLDGLDELVEDDQIRVVEQIRSFAKLHDKTILILTSRIEGYVRPSELLFREAEIAPLDVPEQESLASLILRPVDRRDQFLGVLRSDVHLRRLGESPLLLSLILFIYQESKGQLPKNRTKIYKIFIQWMLKDRDATRDIYQYRNRFDAEEKELFLRKLAYSFFVEGTREFSRDALLSKTHELSPHLRIPKGKEGKFIDEIIQNNGLLTHVHSDRFSFVHLTFQEYYVAKEINDANRLDEVYRHIHDAAWSEVIFFFCGLADFEVTGRLINFILTNRGDYVFAGRCLAHSSTDVPGASERIVPELIRGGSLEAKRTLLEIGGISVATKLSNIVLDPGANAETVTFARDCMRDLDKGLVADVAIGAAEQWIQRDHITKALEVLKTLNDATDNSLSDKIAKVREMLFTKNHRTQNEFRKLLSKGSFDEADAKLKEYGETEDIPPEFNEYLSLTPVLRKTWGTLEGQVCKESPPDEIAHQTAIREAFKDWLLQCKRLRIETRYMQESLAAYCDQMWEREINERWRQRKKIIDSFVSSVTPERRRY